MLSFTCNNCGTTLKLLPNTDASSGPCPKCSAWIDLQNTEIHKPISNSQNHQPTSKIDNQRNVSSQHNRHRIRPDNQFDQTYNEKRDLFALFKIIITAAIVGGLILAIYYFMKRWMTY